MTDSWQRGAMCEISFTIKPGEMVGIATSVRGIECGTPLEAEVRELRLIAEHKPRYNRRSKFPERQHWLKVTVEPFPRLSLVKQVRDDDAGYLGPDEDCRLNLVLEQSPATRVDYALSLNSAFGGANTALLVGAP